MKEIKYKPQPIDTSDVKLPIELEDLVEEMSKNVHEVWLRQESNKGGHMENDVTINSRLIHA